MLNPLFVLYNNFEYLYFINKVAIKGCVLVSWRWTF